MATGAYLRQGLWKCGKGRAFTAFPQAFFFLDEKMPNKITMKRGEGGASATHPPGEPLFKRLTRNFLTIHIIGKGGLNGKFVD